jgi:hypothetical protein
MDTIGAQNSSSCSQCLAAYLTRQLRHIYGNADRSHANKLLVALSWIIHYVRNAAIPRTKVDAEVHVAHKSSGFALHDISAYLHNAFANCICQGVRHSGSNRAGLATRIHAHWAREVATFSRFRL